MTNGKGAFGMVEAAPVGAAVGLTNTKPLVVAEGDVLDGPDVTDGEPLVVPPRTNPPVVVAAAPPSAPGIVPEHAEPTGQQATFPPESLVQIWFVGQQAPLFPCAAQFEYPPGQPWRLKSLAGSPA